MSARGDAHAVLRSVLVAAVAASVIAATNTTSAADVSTTLDENAPPQFVVWNVGQGLWTSLISGSSCRHFDIGGERAPWKEITRACRGKENRASFSHWDWDHVGFVTPARRRLGNFCIEAPPAGPMPEKRDGLLHTIPACPPASGGARDLSRSPTTSRFSFENRLRQPRALGTSNEWSRVFLLTAKDEPASGRLALIPGDSDQKAEKGWAPSLPRKGVWLLVLGHHGSRTATSIELLSRLPDVRMAVASARKAKYGHPHKEVMEKLKKRGIALLKTEDWGSLRFELSADREGDRAQVSPESGP